MVTEDGETKLLDLRMNICGLINYIQNFVTLFTRMQLEGSIAVVEPDFF